MKYMHEQEQHNIIGHILHNQAFPTRVEKEEG